MIKNSYIASPLARNDLGGRGGDDDDQDPVLVGRAADHHRQPAALEFQGSINKPFANRFSLDDLRLNYPRLDLNGCPVDGHRRQLQDPTPLHLPPRQLRSPYLPDLGPAARGREQLETRIRDGFAELGDEAGKAWVRRDFRPVRSEEYLGLKCDRGSSGQLNRP